MIRVLEAMRPHAKSPWQLVELIAACFCADKPAGHEAKHERQHLSETVQDVQRSDRGPDQTRRRRAAGSRETQRTRQGLAAKRRGRRQLGWRRGVVVSGVRCMNEVNAHRARLVPGWVTVFGRVYHLGM